LELNRFHLKNILDFNMADITAEQLLAEIEDVIRTMPPRQEIHNLNPEVFSWWGRASAVINLWDPYKAITFNGYVKKAQSSMALDAEKGLGGVLTMLHQARHELRLKTVGPLTAIIGQGSVFDYFDEVRIVIEAAKSDLLFVDPYLDAEFVSRYLPHVSQGVRVRLLGRERIKTLLPAVELFRKQTGLSIEVRSASEFHDRYVFVDKQSCYQSGASFKDGAKNAPTTLTQIVDAFDAVFNTYEQLWSSGTIAQ
jgi:hypothetical protein